MTKEGIFILRFIASNSAQSVGRYAGVNRQTGAQFHRL